MNNPMMIRTNNNLIFSIIVQRLNKWVYMVRFNNIDSIPYTNVFSAYLTAIIIKKFQAFPYSPVKFPNLYYLVHCSNSSSRVNSVIVNTFFILLLIFMNYYILYNPRILYSYTFKQVYIWILRCIYSQTFFLFFRNFNKFSLIFRQAISLF